MAEPNNPMTVRLAPYAFPIWALFLTSALLFGCVAAFAADGDAAVSATAPLQHECVSVAGWPQNHRVEVVLSNAV